MIKHATDPERACPECPILLNCTERFLKKGEDCDYLLNSEYMTDAGAGALLLILSLLVLTGSLIKLVSTLNGLLKGKISKSK